MIRSALRAATIAIAATAALVVAPTASAAPADLTAVAQADRLVSATWTLPAGATAWVLEVSIDATSAPTASGCTPISVQRTPASPPPSRCPAAPTTCASSAPMTPDACVIGDPSCAYDVSNVRTVTIPSQAATLQAVIHLAGTLAASWTLPAGVDAWAAEISTSPLRDRFGFLDSHPRLAGRPRPGPDDLRGRPVARPGHLLRSHRQHPGVRPLRHRRSILRLRVLEHRRGLGRGARPAFDADATSASTRIRPRLRQGPGTGRSDRRSLQDVDKLSITLHPGEAVKVNARGLGERGGRIEGVPVHVRQESRSAPARPSSR